MGAVGAVQSKSVPVDEMDLGIFLVVANLPNLLVI